MTGHWMCIVQYTWLVKRHKRCFPGKEETLLSLQSSTHQLKVVQSYSIIILDIRTTINLSNSCRKNVFLLKISNKNTFFLRVMDKLMVVLMSIKWLIKNERPLSKCSKDEKVWTLKVVFSRLLSLLSLNVHECKE